MRDFFPCISYTCGGYFLYGVRVDGCYGGGGGDGCDGDRCAGCAGGSGDDSDIGGDEGCFRYGSHQCFMSVFFGKCGRYLGGGCNWLCC